MTSVELACAGLAAAAGALAPRTGRPPGRRLAAVLAEHQRSCRPGGPDSQAGGPGRRERLLRTGASAAAGVLTVVVIAPVTGGPVGLPARVGVGLAVVALVSRWLARLPSRAEAARRCEEAAQLPLLLDLLALALRVGLPPDRAAAEAADAAGPAGGRLAAALRQVARGYTSGGDPAQAWRPVEATALEPVAALMVRAASLGGGVVDELERMASGQRLEAGSRAVAAARSAGVSAVLPLALCFLPAFLLLAVAPVIAGAVFGLHL